MIGVVGCSRNPHKVDISDIDVEIKIKRLDRDLFEVTPLNEKESIPVLSNEYADFFQLYNYKIIQLGDPFAPEYPGFLQSFITHATTVESKNKVDSVFTDLENIEKEFSLAFRYYKYHFPNKSLPGVYTCISGFNQSIIIDEDILGISLDNYLGEDCELYKRLAFSRYKRVNMYPEKLVTDAMQGWIMSEMEIGDDNHRLIDNMIYNGKIMYIMDAMFPDYPDYQKIGFEAEQIDWCSDNAERMWTYMIENRLLYSTDRMTIRRYIRPAPFSAGFTEKSPGRAGIWIGWQIVRKYMENNKALGLPDLIEEYDYQKILSGSQYAPQ
jgi:gliding motility-associated lipoprotein GldB